MSDQEKNRVHEEPADAREFSMPDCCGPMMDWMTGDNKDEPASNWWSACQEMMNKMAEGGNPMKSCPMSAILRKGSGMRGFGMLALIPGLLLVLVGVAIILEPQVLVWLLALTSIVAGLMLLAAIVFFRRVAPIFRS